jgi:hypothetical protein
MLSIEHLHALCVLSALAGGLILVGTFVARRHKASGE